MWKRLPRNVSAVRIKTTQLVSAKDVIEILRDADAGESYRSIAARYGLSYAIVQKVASGKLIHGPRKKSVHPGPPRKSLAERFWAKVNKDGPLPKSCPELGPCHIWTAAINNAGYGVIGSGGRKGTMYLAHRVAFFLEHTRWPEPNACHHCDTPACVNVFHLFEGTDKDNMDDMRLKGRRGIDTHPEKYRLYGEENRMAKLTAIAVAEIRMAYTTGEEVSSLAKRYLVTRACIWDIVSYRTWRDANESAPPKTGRGTVIRLHIQHALEALDRNDVRIAREHLTALHNHYRRFR